MEQNRRSQGSMIEVCGSDPTWGLLPLVSQTANAGAIDMETPMSLLLDRPPQARCVYVADEWESDGRLSAFIIIIINRNRFI